MDTQPPDEGSAQMEYNPLNLVDALRLLADAARHAQWLGRDRWDFAVEIRELLALGLTSVDLRSLLCSGSVEHAAELVDSSASGRSFSRIASLALPEEACFILTPVGEGLLAEFLSGSPPLAEARVEQGTARPRWDAALRELWLGVHLVKRFRSPAASQERVLAAFEEEGWPPRIDDPLSRPTGMDPEQRLHDVVRGLNRNQRHSVLRFGRDGTGQGIFWSSLRPRVNRPRPVPA